jgi:CheY-like chemotaxis protein
MSNRQPRVVLIEDHPLVRAGQRMLLEDAGYRVSEITAGADLAGFAAIRGENQVIIADFDLGPGMTGVEVALEIMRRVGERIPTLVLSASFGVHSKALAAVWDLPVMTKPASEGQVLTWVADAFHRQDSGRGSNGDRAE